MMPLAFLGYLAIGDLKTVHKPEIIFEATGVYSRRLQSFLDEHGYAYTRLNPLEAKKQLDSLRVRKTEIKLTPKKKAQSQFVLRIVKRRMSKKKSTKTCGISAVSIRI